MEPTQTPTPDAPQASKPKRPFHPLLTALLSCAVVTIIAAFMAWAKVGSLAISGLDGDGGITIFLAIVGGLSVAIWRGRTWVLIVNLILALLVTLIAIVDVADINRVADGVSGIVSVSTGIGLWVTLIAGIAWAAIAIVSLAGKRKFRPAVAT